MGKSGTAIGKMGDRLRVKQPRLAAAAFLNLPLPLPAPHGSPPGCKSQSPSTKSQRSSKGRKRKETAGAEFGVRRAEERRVAARRSLAEMMGGRGSALAGRRSLPAQRSGGAANGGSGARGAEGAAFPHIGAAEPQTTEGACEGRKAGPSRPAALHLFFLLRPFRALPVWGVGYPGLRPAALAWAILARPVGASCG
jgi:hypothetical protein